MIDDERDEAVAILKVITDALAVAVPSITGRVGATFRYAVGDTLAQAAQLLEAGTLGQPLLNCFTQALSAGATLDGMGLVVSAMLAETPTGLPGELLVNAGIRMALGFQVKILSKTDFQSSQDALAALDSISGTLDAAQEYAADHRDPAAYQALILLGAKIANDLTQRAATLPRLVNYAMARILTSHALANRLYGDVGRSDELRAENKIINPAFMPLAGRALSEV